MNSSSEKKIKLRGLYELVKRQCSQENELQQVVATLISCFSSDPEVIELSCEILVILMEIDSFTAISMHVFRKLFRYLPFFIQNQAITRGKTKPVQLLTQCLKRFAKNCHLIGQMITDFPFSMLFHLTMLISCQHNSVEEHDVIELMLQTLQMVSHLPKPHGEADTKIVRKLITSCYTAIRNCDGNYLTVASYLRILTDRMIGAFLIPKPNESLYWIEHKIVSIYGAIFDILFCEIPINSAAVHFLLTTTLSILQRDLKLNLKLDIIEQLSVRNNGLQKAIINLHNSTKTDTTLFTLFEAVIKEMLTHYVWQFEFGSTYETLNKLKQKIHKLMLQVTWLDVISSDFQIFNLQRQGISASNLCLIILISHFETEQDKYDWTCNTKRELNHVLNLTTFMSVSCLKQYSVPTYLVKYILEGIANFHNNDLMKQSETTYKEHLRHLMPTNRIQNIFGLIPARIPRLKWFKQCHLQWEAKFIQRQRIEALEERLLPLNVINANMLIHFPMELLFSVLCTNQSTNKAQSNASIIMSRVQLSQAIIEKIITEKLSIRRGCGSKWIHYLRALFGSLGALSGEQQDKIMLFLLTKLNSKAVESAGYILIIDSMTRIFMAKQYNQSTLADGISNLEKN